ncbi:hypothetical protein KY334_07940 [Candidatus Woesearchaeota archaeon]|nr:hypothetical protein [Candidatus Woesearchaeota archaeon]
MAKEKRDYMDVVSHFLFGFFKSKMKSSLIKNIEDAKKHIIDALFDLKRNIFKSAIEITFLLSGIVAIIVGLILLLSKYLPMEHILLVYGILVSLIVLTRARLK